MLCSLEQISHHKRTSLYLVREDEVLPSSIRMAKVDLLSLEARAEVRITDRSNIAGGGLVNFLSTRSYPDT